MAPAAQRTIRIKVDGDGKGLIVTVRTVEKEVQRLSKQVDAANKRMGAAAASTAKLAVALSAVSSSTSGLAAFGATLATATGALIGLPALVGAGAAAMVTMTLGADGAARALKGVNKTLLPLKGQVSAVFEANLAPAVDNLNQLIPQTADGFSAIAREMAGVATAATRTLTLPENTAHLNTVLGRTSGLMSGVRRAAGPMTSALLDITEVGSQGFSSIGNEIAASAEEFAGFIQVARESGQLRQWLDDGIDAARDLWQTFKDVGAIVGGTFSAISEGADGVSSSVQPAIKRMREFVESTRGQAYLQRIGAALAEIGEAVGGTVAAALQVAGPLAASLAQALAALSTTAAGILVPTLQILAPILQTIATWMAENEATVRVVVAALGGLAVAYLSVHSAIKFVTTVTTIWATVSGIAERRTSALGTAFGNMSKSARIASLSMGAIGVVISLAGAAMSIWSSRSEEAAEQQRELAEQGLSVAEAVARQNGVIDENIRAMVAKNLSDAGALRLAEQLGISKSRLVDAILGEGTAYQSLERSLGNIVYLQGTHADATGEEVKAAADLWAIIDGQTGAVRDGAREMQDRVEATRSATTAEQDHTTAIQANIDALLEQVDALREASGIVLSERDATRQFHEAIDAANESIARNGKTLDVTTRAGRENQAALDEIVDSTLGLIASQTENGASTATLAKTMATGRNEFIATARQMGLNETEAIELANSLNLIPSKVRTDVELRDAAARRRAREFKEMLEKIPPERVVNLRVSARGQGHYLPGLATGGPAVGGRTYLVGERGPELFRAPNSGGHVVPNHELAGMGGDTIVYVTIDGQQLQARIDRTVRERDRSTRRAVLAGTGAGR